MNRNEFSSLGSVRILSKSRNPAVRQVPRAAGLAALAAILLAAPGPLRRPLS